VGPGNLPKKKKNNGSMTGVHSREEGRKGREPGPSPVGTTTNTGRASEKKGGKKRPRVANPNQKKKGRGRGRRVDIMPGKERGGEKKGPSNTQSRTKTSGRKEKEHYKRKRKEKDERARTILTSRREKKNSRELPFPTEAKKLKYREKRGYTPSLG